MKCYFKNSNRKQNDNLCGFQIFLKMILFHLTIAIDSFDLILQFGLYRY